MSTERIQNATNSIIHGFLHPNPELRVKESSDEAAYWAGSNLSAHQMLMTGFRENSWSEELSKRPGRQSGDGSEEWGHGEGLAGD